MPIRERVQRLWRLVVDWWRPSRDDRPAATLGTSAPTRPRAPGAPESHRSRGGSAAFRPADGEPLIAGAVTVRMWIVGGRLVLATSMAEAERALVTLLPELDAEAQGAARQLLDTLRGSHAAAA